MSDFFFDHATNDVIPYVESEKSISRSIYSSSIDTSEIDSYRQGVEITSDKYSRGNVVKIHSGEPGHRLSNSNLGQDTNANHQLGTRWFVDNEKFSASSYVAGSGSFLTYPFTHLDGEWVDDGIIEPFMIRDKITISYIDSPFIANDVKGAVMDGNEDVFGRTDSVVISYVIDTNNVNKAFLDGQFQTYGSSSMGGYVNNEYASIKFFSDARYVRNIVTGSTYSSDMISALSPMTGSTENGVQGNERYGATGWSNVERTSVTYEGLVF